MSGSSGRSSEGMNSSSSDSSRNNRQS
jgi:hypothetical protein